MISTCSNSITKPKDVSRIIGKINGKTNGPTVVFFAGIHGNETAGIHALQEVFAELTEDNIQGVVYGIAGNIKALSAGQRYIEEDLNRVWTPEKIDDLNSKIHFNTEEKEQRELLLILNDILESNEGPFYFIDFHTTSSKTLPFITINDALINRKFSKLFPVPVVLGIEEYLNGPLLSYINQLGYVSLGFESGQHIDNAAILNSVSFIYLALVFSNAMHMENVTGFPIHFNQLKMKSKGQIDIFEVVYLHQIKNNDSFKMNAGFESFQDINKGAVLATNNNTLIKSKYNAKLFMPLYQTKGKEGFFIIRRIKPFYLKLSAFLRKIKIDNLLVWLPGISWEEQNKKALVVNLKVARFFAKSIFHLLGYRNKQMDATHIKLYNRERASKTEMYKNELWYKKTT